MCEKVTIPPCLISLCKMEQRHVDLLKTQRLFILKNLCSDLLLDHLASNDILYCGMVENIQCRPDRYAQTAELLDLLPGRGPNAFDIFMIGLQKSGQQYIYDHLSLMLKCKEYNEPQPKYEMCVTNIFDAARYGGKKDVTHCFHHGHSINDTDVNGKTPLHHAVESGNTDNVLHLVLLNANINHPDDVGVTPLHKAIKLNKMQCVFTLLQHNASPNTMQYTDGRTPLQEAIILNTSNERIIRALLTNDAWLDVPDHSGYTALHFAACQNKIEVVKLLLLYGANTSAYNQAGHTPQFYAKKNENNEMISLLT